MSARIDLVGQKFGRLTVLERAENAKNGAVHWKCHCECGNVVIVRGDSLRLGITRSCGCLKSELAIKRNTKHGMSKTPEYDTWSHMLQRCNNPKDANYNNYGFRGITVCDKWKKFDGFFEDMGLKPKGLTIERKNNDLGYCKKNCCWATYTKQRRNQRISKRNKTGVNGVWFTKATQKYYVQIQIGAKRINVGGFNVLPDAIIARRAAEQKYWGRIYSKDNYA